MSDTPKILFTSDLHFFHKNIVEYSGRPWTAEQQTDEIIRRWNNRVAPGDTVYHLGDFAFRNDKQAEQVIDVIAELEGAIHFIRGNHCPSKLWNKIKNLAASGDKRLSRVHEVVDYKAIKVGNQQINLFHYPIAVFDKMHHGAWHLHGHCHGSLQLPGKVLDVGIDNHPDFQVFTYDEVKAHMDNREVHSWGDHHNTSIGRE